MTASVPRLPKPAVALKAMVPGIPVAVGRSDEYLPSWPAINLSPATFEAEDFEGLLRALHEGGHAVQHRLNTRLWRLRESTEAFRVAWALCWLAAFAGFFAATWLGWTFFALGWLVTMANGLVIVLSEREASEIAIGWLGDEVGMADGEEREARAYLAKLRRGYWRTVFGL